VHEIAVVVVQEDGGLARFDVLCLGVAAAVVLAIVPLRRIDHQVRAASAPPR
jgi:hypothetical protein